MQRAFQGPSEQQATAEDLSTLFPLAVLIARGSASQVLADGPGQSLTPKEVGQIIHGMLGNTPEAPPLRLNFRKILARSSENLPGVTELKGILPAIRRVMEKPNTSHNSALLESMSRAMTKADLTNRLTKIANTLCSDWAQQNPAAAFDVAAKSTQKAIIPVCAHAHRRIVGNLADVFSATPSPVAAYLKQAREAKIQTIERELQSLAEAGKLYRDRDFQTQVEDGLLQTMETVKTMVSHNYPSREVRKTVRTFRELTEFRPQSRLSQARLRIATLPVVIAAAAIAFLGLSTSSASPQGPTVLTYGRLVEAPSRRQTVVTSTGPDLASPANVPVATTAAVVKSAPVATMQRVPSPMAVA